MSTIIAHNIAVLNRSSVVDDDEAHAITTALQKQMTDFRKAWNIDAKLNFVPKAKTTGWEGKWNLVLLDDSDVANALGYHDLTPEGLPLGKVFANTDKKYGLLVGVTASHELLEMVLDPMINLVAEDTKRGVFVAYEACDAVEADNLGYEINGVRVSDFVLPNFFNPLAINYQGASYSHLENIHAPFQLAPGGYESVYTPGKGWSQITAKTNGPEPADRPRVGSRRERRVVASQHGHTRALVRSLS